MKLTLELKSHELKALRRAVWTLYSEELARNPFRERKSRIAESCEVLMDKIEAATKKEAR
jgi:hypothetical protein